MPKNGLKMAWNIFFESTNIWVSKHMKSYAERTFLTLILSFAYFRPILAWKLPENGLKTAWKWPEIIVLKVQQYGCQNIWNHMRKGRFWHYFEVLPTSGRFWPENCLKMAWNISFKVQTCGCQNIWNNMWKRRFWHYFYVLPTSGLKTSWNISFESKNIRVLKHMKSYVERTFLTRFLSFCLLQPDFGLKNAWNIALIYIFLITDIWMWKLI